MTILICQMVYSFSRIYTVSAKYYPEAVPHTTLAEHYVVIPENYSSNKVASSEIYL